MTDMLTGTIVEVLANITWVTGDARQRRTIYEADQDFERNNNKGPAALAAAGDDQYPKVSTSPPVTAPNPVAFPATVALDKRRVSHGTIDTAAQLHVCQGARGKGERILLRERERECCLLVLNSVTSTPQWIRQPEAAWGCVWCLCVSMYSDVLGSLSL